MPKVTGTFVPYMCGERSLFTSSRSVQLLDEATPAAKVKCRLCGQMWPSLEMRQHIGYHILATPEKLPSSNPCGFCGGDAALCRSWLETTRDTTKAYTRCGLLGGCAGKAPLEYRYAAAKRMAFVTPCTNHLVECAFCPPEQNKQRPVFWSYNLGAHHMQAHAAHPLPEHARISEVEKEWVLTVGSTPSASLSAAQKEKFRAAAAPAAAAAVAAAAAAAAAAPASAQVVAG